MNKIYLNTTAPDDKIIIKKGGGGTGRYQNKRVTLIESKTTITPDAGYDALSSVSINAPLESKTIELTSPEATQFFPQGLGFSDVTIEPKLQERIIVLMSDDSITVDTEEDYVGMSKVKVVNRYNYDYLTIEALEDGLSVKMTYNDCEYSIDRSSKWYPLNKGTYTPAINTGQTLSFRANATVYNNFNNSKYGIGTFTITKKCNVWGNVMSLMNKDNPHEATLEDRNFDDLFSHCSTIVSCKDLCLPTYTKRYCYASMFYGCTSLVNAPELPATDLTVRCYYNMFNGCTSLVNAPELPAMTVFGGSYERMFYGCTSLVNAPELPATELNYYYVGGSDFAGCYKEMFKGCTSLVNAPELPATTLVVDCYVYMFYGCSNLNYIKAMFTNAPSSVSNATQNWVIGVSSVGTFVKNSAATWDIVGVDGIPEGWTVEIADE